MSNKEIAAQFELLAELLELAGESSFKIKSYSIAAFRISKLPQPLLEMTEAAVKKIENIGPAVLAKIDEIKATGTMQALEELIASTPPGIIEMLQIKGLGAKKVRQLWLELEIETIGELAYACQENRLAALKGFGAKTQENILKNILFIQANKGKFLLAQIRNFAIGLHEEIINAFPENNTYLVGDISRQMNIVESIEFISDISFDLWTAFFESGFQGTYEEKEHTLLVRLPSLPLIRIIPLNRDNQGWQLFRHQSSAQFTEAFAKLYPMEEKWDTEAALWKHAALPYIPPPLREIENFEYIRQDNFSLTPIAERDIKGLIHCHSTWSDGVHSIREMAEACIRKGYEYMVLTDHSVSAFYANGLTEQRIREQHREIDRLNGELAPFRIFKGIEADILYSGELDYNEAVWTSFDMIIASVHSNLRMNPEKASERVLKALDNPYVRILGHPTGRLLLSREGYPVDIKAVIDKCAERNIVIELNTNPRRLDIDWSWVNYAISKGVMLSLNPDAHSMEGIDHIEYGILSAQKSMLTKENNLSSFSLPEMLQYLGL